MNMGTTSSSSWRNFIRRLLSFSLTSKPAPMQQPAREPLIAVLGTTGVGKSQLAIELATSLSAQNWPKKGTKNASHPSLFDGAEIVNGDSMQIYRGLPVVTNKTPIDERKGIPHHLMDYVDPTLDYSVTEFQKDALGIIDELHSRSKLPILVGGTTYYVQNVIFPNRLVTKEDRWQFDEQQTQQEDEATSPSSFHSEGSAPPSKDLERFSPILRPRLESLPAELLDIFFLLRSLPPLSSSSSPTFPQGFPVHLFPPRLGDFCTGYRRENWLAQRQDCEEDEGAMQIPATVTPLSLSHCLHRILSILDPDMASKWHPNDVRKIRRSLEVICETGDTYTEVVERQRKREAEDLSKSRPRYRTLIFWLVADWDVLDHRLDSRVDEMLKNGLLEELSESRKTLPKDFVVDFSRGVWQNIGYKEFSPYFEEPSSSSSDPLPSLSDSRITTALEQMKLATRQYARRQVKWLRNQLLPPVRKWTDTGDVRLFVLDATDLTKWNVDVKEQAQILAEKFLKDEELPDPFSLSKIANSLLTPPQEREPIEYKECPVCTTDSACPAMFPVKETEWKGHLQSKRHRGNVKRIQKSQRRASQTIVNPLETTEGLTLPEETTN